MIICLKCSHTFNLLDAAGAISVTERTGYIARVRKLARGVRPRLPRRPGGEGVPDAEKTVGKPGLTRPALVYGSDFARAGYAIAHPAFAT